LFTGTPAAVANLRQASYSGAALTASPSSPATLTGTLPHGVSTSTSRRGRTWRCRVEKRTPMVVDSRKMAAATASRSDGGQSAATVSAGRDFFITIDVNHAS